MKAPFFLSLSEREREREERVSTRERESHRQLNLGARTAEIIRLTIHQLVALCQLNQCKAAKDKILWGVCVRACVCASCSQGHVKHKMCTIWVTLHAETQTYSDCGCLSSVSPWPAHGLLHLCNNKKRLTTG